MTHLSIKFHGPRSKLAEPLRRVLAWAQDPGGVQQAREAIAEQTGDAEGCLALCQVLEIHLSGGASIGRVPKLR
jgi:hypothetical protein